MKKLMGFLMISCRKATELTERQAFPGLNSWERFQLYLHRRMCDACNNYARQHHFIDRALHSLPPSFPDVKLSEKKRQDIIRKIESMK